VPQLRCLIEELASNSQHRVLLLGIPNAECVRLLAVRLERGLIFGMGPAQKVAEARRACRELVNVMFHPGDPTEIPWQDQFFSCAVGVEPSEWESVDGVVAEVFRVLSPDGLLYMPEPLEIRHPGFVLTGVCEGWRRWQKAGSRG